MYFVIEGSNTVALERRGIQLGKLSSGDFFGELAALLPPELEEHKTRTSEGSSFYIRSILVLCLSPSGGEHSTEYYACTAQGLHTRSARLSWVS